MASWMVAAVAKPSAKKAAAAPKAKAPAKKAVAKKAEALTAEEEDELVEMLVEEAVAAVAAANKVSSGAAVQITSSKVRGVRMRGSRRCRKYAARLAFSCF